MQPPPLPAAEMQTGGAGTAKISRRTLPTATQVMKMQTAATSAATGPIPEILVVAKSMVNMLQVSVTKMPRPAGTSRLGLLLPRRWSLPLAVTSDCCYRGSVKAKGRQ